MFYLINLIIPMFFNLKNSVSLVFLAFFITCCAQKKEDVLKLYQYQKIPDSLEKSYLVKDYTLPKEAWYVKIEEVDQKNIALGTKYLQSILDKHSKIVLPDAKIMISREGLKLNSNQEVYFQKNTVLEIEANSLDKYAVISVESVKNVRIVNPRIIGDRVGHLEKTGEHGHGISVLGSENVTIKGFEISNCWGDGLYIGMNAKQKGSENVIISNGILDNNRRNGISITNVIGFSSDHVISSNANGAEPMFGLDIEPNWSANHNIKDVNIRDFITYNNANGGLMIAIHKMQGDEVKNININIKNYKDYGSYHGLYFGGIPSGNKNLKGVLEVDNIILSKNTVPIKLRSNQNQENFRFSINNFKVEKPLNKSYSTKEINKILSNKKVEFKNIN